MKKLTVLAFFLSASLARADWPADAGVDVPVANVGSSETPAVIADQQGGVFVIFAHQESAPSATLRGEHFDATGKRLWGTADVDGGFIGKDLLGLSIGANNGGKTQAFTDQAGGVIAVYVPGNSAGPFTIDVQRFDANGAPQWTPTGAFGGVELLTNPSNTTGIWGVPDQTGGALVVYDTASGSTAQRVDSTGAARYGTGYVFSGAQPVATTYAPTYLNGDGQGGMYFIWPNGGSASISPVLDHLDPVGSRTFEAPSVAPLLAAYDEWTLSGLADGGGSWAAWYQPGIPGYVYLQLFANDGGAIFTDGGDAGGLLVATTADTPTNPTLLSDGTGGVVLAWSDVVNGTFDVIYAQRFGADGRPRWGAQPLIVNSSETTPQGAQEALPDFRLVSTTDNNVAFFWTTSPGIYAEKIAIDGGSKLWGPLSGGIAVSTVAPFGTQWLDATFVEDDSAYVTYQTNVGSIYVKHVLPDGTLGPTGPAVDGGPSEDGGTDAGVDAGPIGDGGTDAGGDAGPIEDGGRDGGLDAGGTPDSGSGMPDAGTPTPDGGTSGSSGGCGCSSTYSGGPWEVGVLALGLVLANRLRRRSS